MVDGNTGWVGINASGTSQSYSRNSKAEERVHSRVLYTLLASPCNIFLIQCLRSVLLSTAVLVFSCCIIEIEVNVLCFIRAYSACSLLGFFSVISKWKWKILKMLLKNVSLRRVFAGLCEAVYASPPSARKAQCIDVQLRTLWLWLQHENYSH